MPALDKITIKGFKSIQNLENFELKRLNIIVGANGAGKSNLISFFHLLRNFVKNRLNLYVANNGGADAFLYNGPKETDSLFFEVKFGERGYYFSLRPTINNYFSVDEESRYYERGQSGWWQLGGNPDGLCKMYTEAKSNTQDGENSRRIYNAISSWQLYHFHDTSLTAGMRRYGIFENWEKLQPDASNIAAFLLNMKQKNFDSYQEIVNAIQIVLPFFHDFSLKIEQFGEQHQLRLSWSQKGSDYPMQPYHLSDGSIRFICLATALLQPNPPSTIIIDEPELGLHPEAIAVLAELLKIASSKTQVIVATQSPILLNFFGINDIIVAKRKNGASTFERLDEADFTHWLEDYNVGELWIKNIIQGGTAHE